VTKWLIPAEGYESSMVSTLLGPCARILIQAADPKPGERVLDVGCDTGIVKHGHNKCTK
jgi:protein-L-isoaspartate O-methyltransferase